MTDFDLTLKQADKFVKQYLKLQKKKDILEEKISKLKQKIADFSKESRLKTLKSGNTLLFVTHKLKTVFPKVGEAGRKQLEEIMRVSGEWKQAITFDIVKLGQAFDKKKLSESLMKKLKPFTRKEEMIRISAKEIDKEKITGF